MSLEYGERKLVGRKPNGNPRYNTTIRGLKITPSNPEGEPCEGVPAHDKYDILTLSPSIRVDRLETIKRIFLLQDTTATNPTQIATLLNSEKVPPIVGKVWNGPRVGEILKNPVYMGTPASNKKGAPRFHEVVDNSLVRVQTQGHVKQRRRTRDQWTVPPAPIFPAIVDPERWRASNSRSHRDDDAPEDRQALPVRSPPLCELRRSALRHDPATTPEGDQGSHWI